MLILFMYVSFWQNIDSATSLLGSLTNLDVAYVRQVLAECWLYCLFTWRSKSYNFVYVHKLLAESGIYYLFARKVTKSGFCLCT